MKMIKALAGACLVSLVTVSVPVSASDGTGLIPAGRFLTNDELVVLLDKGGNEELASTVQLYETRPDEGLQGLAGYFRENFSTRYFFNWKHLGERFRFYTKQFPSRLEQHRQNAEIHMGLYPAAANWKLPYQNLKGDPVSAYELRHLARQHKMLDMAFLYHYENHPPEYVDYFTRQMRSLNAAFESGQFEDDNGGNGVYESFRAGYRVMNWLQVHAFYLGSEHYAWQDQIELIRTLLQTGAILHSKNKTFRYGNHQTRGVAALAMIAILLRDFEGTDTWYRDAMAILGQHLEKEVNSDGFQFERSVHYHISDIYNFFQVLQLAQLNNLPVPAEWRLKLKGMFDAAVLMARSDRMLPVFQDDTDQPWAEYNEMGDFMLLGSVLFDDPVINYFASDSVASSVYWLLRKEQIEAIAHLERQRPGVLSTELPETGYYVMRDGWDKDDFYMAITAGLSEHKPDHQHGDMLGLVARANGQEILPNYQVRYFLDDFEYFKNSFVKNVAIIDGIPQGTGWKSNKGGSGFGKWEELPTPRVISWIKRENWDFFAGSHDGYADLDVDYYRKVLFIKGLGWIVRDLLDSSTGEHSFQQIWQGHYSDEGSANHHRSTFADGSGLEILQLGDLAESWSSAVHRGKGNLVYTMEGNGAGYTTLLYPFKSFSNRIPEAFFKEGRMDANGWVVRIRGDEDLDVGGFTTDARLVIESGVEAFLIGATRISWGANLFKAEEQSEFHLDMQSRQSCKLTSLGHQSLNVISRSAGVEEPSNLPPGSSVALTR